jgi:glycosyltransferase involved in cell wall biosynthesis
MTPKSIIFVVNTLTHGGAEIQVSRLANGLQCRGWQVGVVAMVRPDALDGQLRSAGIEVHCLNMKPGIPNPVAIFKLARFIRARRPQIVHSHIVHANLLARVTRLVVKMPVLICTAHSFKEGGRLHDIGYRLTDRLSDLTTGVSQAAVDRYLRLGLARADGIRFIPNGIDVRRFQNDPSQRRRLRDELGVGDRFVWLVVARLEPDKNHANLFRAFSSAALNHPANPVLLVVGAGRLESEVRRLVEQMQLSARVRFLGLRDDVPALMNAADAQVLSSSMEGMPLVLQEASAVGLPVVATDVGGNAEVVSSGKSGVIVPSDDSRALARAMCDIMSMTPVQRDEMGQAGRRHVETNYDIERVLDRWEAIFEELSEVGPAGAVAPARQLAKGIK